jgi:hypothetical protein
VKDANTVLQEIFNLPPDTASAMLLIQAGVQPMLTITRFVRFGDDNRPVFKNARFELVAIDDQDTPRRHGQLDTTSLDDAADGKCS